MRHALALLGSVRGVPSFYRRVRRALRPIRLALMEARHPGVRRDRLDEVQIRRFLAYTLAEDSNCVDVGAHRGTLLERMTALAPKGHHIAYEPIPELAEDLARRFPAAEIHQAAVAAEPSISEFVHIITTPALSGIRERQHDPKDAIERINVSVTTLDISLPPDYIPHLIKIDVEGGERGVIEGGLELIRTHRPMILFEHGRGAAEFYGTAPEDIHHLLCEQAGLRIFDLDGNGPYDRDTFRSAYEKGKRWNYIAHR